MDTNTIYGYPVATLEGLPGILKDLGIHTWKKTAPTVSLQEYLERKLTETEQEELKYAPRTEVLTFENPVTHEPYTAFRSVGKPWVTVLALIPYHGAFYVPVTVEFKHGTEEVVIVPPSGIKSEADNTYADTAFREFEEETGFELTRVVPLTDGIMQGATVRQNTSGVYPFFGILKTPIVRKESKLDHHETLKVILFEFNEWQRVVARGLTHDMSSVVVTYLALMRMMDVIV